MSCRDFFAIGTSRAHISFSKFAMRGCVSATCLFCLRRFYDMLVLDKYKHPARSLRGSYLVHAHQNAWILRSSGSRISFKHFTAVLFFSAEEYTELPVSLSCSVQAFSTFGASARYTTSKGWLSPMRSVVGTDGLNTPLFEVSVRSHPEITSSRKYACEG